MDCIYCNRSYSSKSALNKHQQTALKCRSIQEKSGIKTLYKYFECSFCEKHFTCKKGYDYHIGVCKIKRQADEDEKTRLLEMKTLRLFMEKQSETISQLKQEMDLLKSKPSNQTINNTSNTNTNSNNTNITNNISITNYMTEERVLQIFKDNFSKNDLPEKKLADFTYKWFLKGHDKPVYLCTDPTRKRFVFMDEQGKEVVDKNCSTLISLLYQAKPYIKDFIQDEIIDQPDDEVDKIRDQYDSFMNLEKNGTDYKLQLCKVLPPIPQIKPTQKSSTDDINWNINKERRQNEQKEEQIDEEDTNPDDPFGFFA